MYGYLLDPSKLSWCCSSWVYFSSVIDPRYVANRLHTAHCSGLFVRLALGQICSNGNEAYVLKIIKSVFIVSFKSCIMCKSKTWRNKNILGNLSLIQAY